MLTLYNNYTHILHTVFIREIQYSKKQVYSFTLVLNDRNDESCEAYLLSVENSTTEGSLFFCESIVM